MKKLVRVIVFLAVFALGVVVISNLIKQDEIKTASDLEDPTLPVMYLDLNGVKADCLYGYKEEIDTTSFRDALIPVNTDREISISYKAYDNEIRSVSYEVTAPDSGEVVGNAQIGNFKEDGEYMTATFTLNTSFLMNREYPICFTLETASGNIYYYARIIQRSVDHAADYVQFVNNFYETCLNKEAASSLTVYLESDESSTTKNFNDVSLTSTFDQVTWENLSSSILRKGTPTIKEINDNTCSLTNEYLLSAINDEGKTEIYRVEEFYRLRYTSSRMRVLDFNRTTTEVFDPDSSDFMTATGLTLGVSSTDIEYVSDSEAKVVGFVQNGTLWQYNDTKEKLTRVFSFRDDTIAGDERYDHDDYGIKIIRVNSDGDMDFIVYGYMNRGEYEGRQGILICHYQGQNGVIEVQTFIPDDRSPEYIANDLERLNYINEDNVYYAYIAGSVYKVDLTEKTYEVVVSNIEPDCFVSSEDNTIIAWMDEMESNASTHITILNTKTGESRKIEAQDGTYLKALGFINDDFIYGIANIADLQQDTTGDLIFAMKKLVIEEFDGTEVLTYEKDGIYVTDVIIENGLIDMTRVTKNENGVYTSTTTDNILNNQETSSKNVSVSTSSNSRQGKVVILNLPSTVSNMKPLVSTSSFSHEATVADLNLEHVESESALYYVYAKGSLIETTTDAQKAVADADENTGVALNAEGQYIYERGNKSDENEIQNDQIPDAFKSGSMNVEELQEAIGDEGTVIDLSGCSLEEVLYQVSLGRPVLARKADGSKALIVGYNNYNTRLYNFETGEHYWFGINDSTNEFASGGNVFITYVPKEKTIK